VTLLQIGTVLIHLFFTTNCKETVQNYAFRKAQNNYEKKGTIVPVLVESNETTIKVVVNFVIPKPVGSSYRATVRLRAAEIRQLHNLPVM
jgi:hypothetical protein